MKTIIATIGIIVLLSATPSVFAISDYQSGFKHGVADGRQAGTDWLFKPEMALHSIHGSL